MLVPFKSFNSIYKSPIYSLFRALSLSVTKQLICSIPGKILLNLIIININIIL